MNVSIFKNIKDVTNPYNKNVYYALERIKSGKSKELVERIRAGEDLKRELPYVCFSGTFEHRSAKGLKNHSGLICLDFDKFNSFQDVIDFKNSICDDSFIFSCWISPSGNGLKVLVKIPAEPENHKGYFDALKKHFDHPNFDISTSDVSRACFESYDSDLFVNPDSLLFTDIEHPDLDDLGGYSVSLPVTSDNRIIENLLSWWNKKYGNSKGSRNNNLYKLAIAFNDFGVERYEAENVLSKYEEKDFSINEIRTIINSAYRKSDNFRTKFFEDKPLKTQVEKMVRNGKTVKDIQKELPNIKPEVIATAVDSIKEDIQVNDFWHYDDKGKIKLSPHKFKFWLEQNNFYKYFPNSGAFVYIKKDRNLIEETDEKRIKDFVLDYLLSRQDIGFAPYDFMATNTKYFNFDFLSFLESIDIELKEDTDKKCYLYYNNCALEISEDGVNEIDYLDLNGFVWKRQVIERDYKKYDHHDAVFKKFLWLISGKDDARYLSLKSVIGFMLHSYKTSATNRAIIFNDETISENPNGGSGKSLIADALSKIKKTSIIDGKNFDQTDKFAYQTVSDDTQLLVFDDVRKNFNFENLFSIITGGIKLEYKNQGAIKLPISRTPKLLITTNYTIGGVGGSFERRKFEVEVSNYFGAHHTPLDEFNHMFFDDWDSTEWLRFDNFMIDCLKYYLKNGLVKSDYHNLETRKFIKETSFEFYEWSQEVENIPINYRKAKNEMFYKFLEDYPDFKKWLTQKRFSTWLDLFGKFKGYEVVSNRSASTRYVEFIDRNNSEVRVLNDENETPF